MKLAAIIVAAGSSQRMGFDKLLAPVAGKPVLQHSIDTFLACREVDEVIVVCPRSRFDAMGGNYSGQALRRVDGGVDRHDSVAAGLNLLNDYGEASEPDFVAVHDGARPLICSSQIGRVFHDAQRYQCAVSARPVTETVKRATSDGFVSQSVDRENLWLMETPQIFRADLLKQAYRRVLAEGKRVTDEVSALELIGQTTHLVSNPGPNPKITYPHDLVQAEQLLSCRRTP